MTTRDTVKFAIEIALRSLDYPEDMTEWIVDEAIKPLLAEAWKNGEVAGHSRAMRFMSDEPNVIRATNPYEEKEAPE